MEMKETKETKDYYTPLYRAVRLGDAEGIKALVDLGAEANAKDDYGQTPLHLAAGYGHAEAVELLIGLGAEGE